MADDVTPPDIRARRFDVARRGYDREQVDSYLAHLADEIDHLSGKLQDRKTNELKVGLDDPEALALELAAIGGEVSMVLEAARAAAEGMRGRATSDVEEWRTTTQEQTQVAMADATEQSQSMRASAWNEGSSMLASSLAEAKALVDSAREDALFIRAEAEREAIRLTGDAKRDREESLRSARMESDQMLEAARNESEGILAAAGQQADQAQERARALEDRRSELLAELESTRASISHLEEEIDSKRQELETPPPEPEPDLQQRSHHTTDGGSVRIVAPSKSVTLKPVDAEEFVADVVALRAGADAESGSEPDVTIVEPETVTVIAPPPPVEEPTEPEPTADIATDDERPTTNDEEPEPTSDDIGSLFASLRETTDSQESTNDQRPTTDDAEPTPEAEPTNDKRRTTDESVPTNDERRTTDESESTNDRRQTTDDEEPDTVEEPEALDKLIPLQNAALKDIKRTLVDLQNDALEHLRTDESWKPKKPFTKGFDKPFAELAEGITGTSNDAGAAKAFSGDLHAALTEAIDKAKDSGAGGREIASMVSRVFRMWRADESERRVVDAAHALQQNAR